MHTFSSVCMAFCLILAIHLPINVTLLCKFFLKLLHIYYLFTKLKIYANIKKRQKILQPHISLILFSRHLNKRTFFLSKTFLMLSSFAIWCRERRLFLTQLGRVRNYYFTDLYHKLCSKFQKKAQIIQISDL